MTMVYLKKFKNEIYPITVLAIILAFAIFYDTKQTAWMNIPRAKLYLATYKEELMQVCDYADKKYITQENCPDVFAPLWKYHLKAIDGRGEGVQYIFAAENPEKSYVLYYYPNCSLSFMNYDFVFQDGISSILIDNIGIENKGSIQCDYIQNNWYFIQAYIPT